jgi:hypothetical protein
MTPVTQLRRTETTQLAAVSGAPRPLLPSALRAPITGSADVIEFRPAPRALPSRAPHTRPVDAGESTGAPGAPAKAQPTSVGDTETAERISGIARSVAQGALEVLAGSRPLQQMARWLDPENYERLQLRANLVRCITSAAGPSRTDAPASAHRQVVVRSARVCPVTDGIYEASVVAFDQKRVRAVALRIEQRRGAWRVTALEIG